MQGNGINSSKPELFLPAIARCNFDGSLIIFDRVFRALISSLMPFRFSATETAPKKITFLSQGRPNSCLTLFLSAG